MTRVLFVCLGNICRSPGAEAVFRSKARKAGLTVETDSAGTANWHQGKPPYGPMQDAAAAHGYDMSDLRARQVRPADFTAFDLLIAMDRQNITDLQAILPRNASVKLALFTDYTTGADHVPDPYYTRDFDGALALIEECADGLICKLTSA